RKLNGSAIFLMQAIEESGDEKAEGLVHMSGKALFRKPRRRCFHDAGMPSVHHEDKSSDEEDGGKHTLLRISSKQTRIDKGHNRGAGDPADDRYDKARGN